jgi:protein-ribulosamine 3-kinase
MFQTQEKFQFIESILFDLLGHEPEVSDWQFFYGGNFNLAVRVKTPEGHFFVKWNNGEAEGMFEAEARGLELLRNTQVLNVPQVLGYGRKPEGDYLVLEFVESGPQQPTYWKDFGQKLAQLHTQHTHDYFGLGFNNYIGALAQNNRPMTDGIEFFVERRLKAQVGRAWYEHKISGHLKEQFEAFYEKLPQLIPNEKPALVHGDLWSGNVMTSSEGWVSLIDPSTHYGLREAELAFTTMFGGFDTAFYESYYHAAPLTPGFAERIPIYNLYPLLVHFNLFGGGYLPAIEKILRRFL